MIKICAWCEKDLGESEPLDDKSISHGICDACLTKESEMPYVELDDISAIVKKNEALYLNLEKKIAR